MWTSPLDLLVRRFPGSSALAATTILGTTPSCVVVHRRVVDLVEAYADALPYAARLRAAVPTAGTELTVLLHLEPLLRRLAWLLDELVEHPHQAHRLTRRLDALLVALESSPTPPPRCAGRRPPRAARPTTRPLP